MKTGWKNCRPRFAGLLMTPRLKLRSLSCHHRGYPTLIPLPTEGLSPPGTKSESLFALGFQIPGLCKVLTSHGGTQDTGSDHREG